MLNSQALGKLRDEICTQGDKWLVVINDKAFKKQFSLTGESLTNPPRGYAKDHPVIYDLKREDFIAISQLDDSTALKE